MLSPDALYTAKLVAYTEEDDDEDGGPAGQDATPAPGPPPAAAPACSGVFLSSPPPAPATKPSFCRLAGSPSAPPAVEWGSLCSTAAGRPAFLLWGRPSQGASSDLRTGNRPVSAVSRQRQPSVPLIA